MKSCILRNLTSIEKQESVSHLYCNKILQSEESEVRWNFKNSSDGWKWKNIPHSVGFLVHLDSRSLRTNCSSDCRLFIEIPHFVYKPYIWGILIWNKGWNFLRLKVIIWNSSLCRWFITNESYNLRNHMK